MFGIECNIDEVAKEFDIFLTNIKEGVRPNQLEKIAKGIEKRAKENASVLTGELNFNIHVSVVGKDLIQITMPKQGYYQEFGTGIYPDNSFYKHLFTIPRALMPIYPKTSRKLRFVPAGKYHYDIPLRLIKVGKYAGELGYEVKSVKGVKSRPFIRKAIYDSKSQIFEEMKNAIRDSMPPGWRRG